MTRHIPLTLMGGERAEIRAVKGEQGTILSPTSSPPGSTVRGRIEGTTSEFQLKVRNCRKEGDGFVLEGRIINATRELKALLSEAPSS